MLPEPRIDTPRLSLRMLVPDDAPRVLDYFRRNQDHLHRWEPPRPPNFHTIDYWAEQLAKSQRDFAEERALRLWLLPRTNPLGPVIGLVHFSRLVRGAFLCAGLGYGLDERVVGQGLMQEALRASIAHMFDERGFHRIEANYRPENVRSGRVLAALGFTVEGYAKDYLLIDRTWTDHVLTSLTRPSP
jgi:ribosomal-protein-alanine N-acetyltransferase